jgi:hypothetical protein
MTSSPQTAWPIVRGLLENLLFDGRDYLVEGVNLRPATVAAFIAESDAAIRACFLGYPSLTAEAKAVLVTRHAGLPNDWLNGLEPDYVSSYLKTCVELSAYLRDECSTLGLPFFDTGADFQGGVRAAERALLAPTNP